MYEFGLRYRCFVVIKELSTASGFVHFRSRGVVKPKEIWTEPRAVNARGANRTLSTCYRHPT